jgi:hypothetical protein
MHAIEKIDIIGQLDSKNVVRSARKCGREQRRAKDSTGRHHSGLRAARNTAARTRVRSRARHDHPCYGRMVFLGSIPRDVHDCGFCQ